MEQMNFGDLETQCNFKRLLEYNFAEFLRKDLFQFKTFAKERDLNLNNSFLDVLKVVFYGGLWSKFE